MSVVDHLLKSLIRYLQKKQKARTKKKIKRGLSRISRKTPRTKSVKKRSLGGKRTAAQSKVRAIKRPVKKLVGKSAVLKKSTARLKAKSRNVPHIKKTVGKFIKEQKPSQEACVGEITHFFSRINVVVLKMTKGSLRVNRKIRIWGKDTDFVQKVGSLQIESVDVKTVQKGQLVGLKVDQPVNVGSKVYLIK